MEWSTACPDWERRIVARESLIPFPPLFPAEAKSALAVFRELRVVDVQNGPTMGELCRPWIMDFVGAVFGAYDPEGGRRLITEFFQLISKKNGKSTTAAGIMLTALIRNWRESAEFLILAPTVEIANNSFYPARDMVRKDEELDALFQVQDHVRTITHRGNGATLKVVAADAETVGGKKATGILVDELWLFGKQPNAENMLREACGGMASRPEGFTIFLSTQSETAPAGVFKQKLQYARGVRDGRIVAKHFLPVIYEHPPAMIKAKTYLARENWALTNPNLGASVDPEFLEQKLREAEENGAESLCGFLSKHFNIEIGLALMSDRWAGADYWEAQARPAFTLDELIAACEVLTVGIDGGGHDDLLGFCVIGRVTGTRNWMVWTHAWAHPDVLIRRKSEAERLRDFAAEGSLTITTEHEDDVTEVASIVAHVEASGKLNLIGVDAGGLGGILDALGAVGIIPVADGGKIVAIKQGGWLNGAILTTERKLAENKLIHGGQLLMNWCIGNAKIEVKGMSMAITKQTSGKSKIDPLCAMLDAAELMSRNPVATCGIDSWLRSVA